MVFHFPKSDDVTNAEEKPDYFYTKSSRTWTFRMVDSYGNQKGDAEFYFSKREVMKRLREVNRHE